MKKQNIKISKQPIIFIVGQTASGKSSLAMKLARQFDGEIICADSQTLRKGLDIGTAKPSPEDQLKVTHHMIDIIEPYERYSVSDYQRESRKLIDDIRSRNRLVIVVGGSGLYIDSLIFDYDLESEQDLELKKHLESKSITELQLIIKDNGYKMPINSHNPRHLVGVIIRQGKYSQDDKLVEGSMIYGLSHSNEELKSRISTRVDKMFSLGLVSEVEKIIEKYGKPPENLDAIGYGIVSKYLDGELNESEARESIKRGHWQYARRQKSWFKRNKYIQWLDDSDAALKKIVQDIALFKV